MPRGDKTGPQGWGAMTGRSKGYCKGNEIAGFKNDNHPRRKGDGMGPRYRNGMEEVEEWDLNLLGIVIRNWKTLT